MVTDWAFAGMVICGSSGLPLESTTTPFLSIWNDPSRVYARVPVVMRTWKNPFPWMATSSGLPVWFMLPWVKMISLDDALVPSPSCSPAGTVVCCPALTPGNTILW